MSSEEALKLENQTCFAVYACAKEITRLYQPVLKELGLTYTQYIAMLALWERDSVSVKELGERLFLDSGTLTPLLKKLEAQGLLTRSRDSGDERQLLIRLSAAGVALREKALEVPEKVFCQSGVNVEMLLKIRSQMSELMTALQPVGAADKRGE
ncbi:MarR family winged helix-turn-helix transcriptional regulator [Cohnella sp. GCM10012308]|uniref:MarR family winged helix-turn-helix transcriptional regulator n=1 Tax=Cohnella sp. GCM10012308 TaxID=3317329 RepID=UPI003621FE49